ncbi:hypothetical protein KAR91_81580 [Candidatus Pacearchaeota archaeon]|nr:hypothetical protein [Candidatus Pacearchaeota archaeon]
MQELLTLEQELDYCIWLKEKTGKDIQEICATIKKLNIEGQLTLKACWACGELVDVDKFSSFRDGTICCNCAEQIHKNCQRG